MKRQSNAIVLSVLAAILVRVDVAELLAAENPRSRGIANITKGPPASTLPTNAPAGEMRWYGAGLAFQAWPGPARLPG